MARNKNIQTQPKFPASYKTKECTLLCLNVTSIIIPVPLIFDYNSISFRNKQL